MALRSLVDALLKGISHVPTHTSQCSTLPATLASAALLVSPAAGVRQPACLEASAALRGYSTDTLPDAATSRRCPSVLLHSCGTSTSSTTSGRLLSADSTEGCISSLAGPTAGFSSRMLRSLGFLSSAGHRHPLSTSSMLRHAKVASLGSTHSSILEPGPGCANRFSSCSRGSLQLGQETSTSYSRSSPLLASSVLTPALSSCWSSAQGQVRGCFDTRPLSRQRVMKRFGFNKVIMPNTTTLKFGKYGIRAMTERRVADNCLEAVRRTLRRKLKKTARLWIRIRCTVPVTKKPLGVRMGKGKGAIEYYCTPVRPGQIIFEMDRITKKLAIQALQAIRPKFPCKLGLVVWD